MSKFEIMRRPAEYIEHLQNLNRAKKLRESVESHHNEELIKKESNFQLFLNGANDVRVREHRKREESEKSKSPACTKTAQNYAQIHRKQWGKPEVPVLDDPKTKNNWASKVVVRNGSMRRSRDRRAFKVTGGVMARPETTKKIETEDLVHRIDKLGQKHKEKLMLLIEKFEKEGE